MILYHASTMVVDHPDVEHSRPNLDFGRGFLNAEMLERHLHFIKGERV